MSHETIKATTLANAYMSIYEENGIKGVKTNINIPVSFRNKNILYVINENYNMNMVYALADLTSNLSSDYNIYVLGAYKSKFIMYKYNPRTGNIHDLLEDNFKYVFEYLKEWNMKQNFSLEVNSSKEYESVYEELINDYNIDIIHIEHMAYHTSDLLKIAKNKQINTIVTLNDLYYLNPTSIIDDEYLKYDENNPVYDEDNVDVIYPNIELFNQLWTKRCNEMFKYPDYIIAPSKTIYDIYTKTFPEIKDKTIILKPGYDMKISDKIKLQQDKPIRILIPTNINTNDDFKYIKELKKQDTNNQIQLHFMGENKHEYTIESLAKTYPIYNHKEFKKQIENIKPHFIGLFSKSQTDTYDLIESWNNTTLPLAINNTPNSEYVDEYGGGYIISENPEDAYNEIIKLASDKQKYQTIADEIPFVELKDIQSMVDEHVKIYEKKK